MLTFIYLTSKQSHSAKNALTNFALKQQDKLLFSNSQCTKILRHSQKHKQLSQEAKTSLDTVVRFVMSANDLISSVSNSYQLILTRFRLRYAVYPLLRHCHVFTYFYDTTLVW